MFWNFTEAEISGLNVTINGFTITAADLDWSGDGASLLADCSGSFRRVGDNNDATDWSGICEASDYGAPNSDIDISAFEGCLASRTPTEVTAEDIAPEVTCPSDVSETIDEGEMFTIPDYTGDTTATDNCTSTPAISQDPAPGTEVSAGTTVITMTASDGENEATCTFNLVVEEILGVGDVDFYNNLVLYPNPTTGEVTLLNKSNKTLASAQITDVNGRVIQQLDLSNTGFETIISMEEYASGIYFIKIEATDASIVKRIVKQ